LIYGFIIGICVGAAVMSFVVLPLVERLEKLSDHQLVLESRIDALEARLNDVQGTTSGPA